MEEEEPADSRDAAVTAAAATISRRCLAVRTRMLDRVVTGIYDEALRPFGVRSTQVSILIATARMGTARPGDICRVLCLDPSTLSRNVDRLRARGWVEEVAVEDGRERPFQLTEAGTALVLEILPAWEAAQAQAEALLGEEGVALFHGFSSAVSQGQL